MTRPTARYRVKRACGINGLIRPVGEVVQFEGWPNLGELEPVDDDAKAIAAYFRVNNPMSGAAELLPDTPYGANGKLHLPLLGLPRWKLGPSYAARETAHGINTA